MVDTFWAVTIALLMPSVYGPAMLVTVSLLAFVANEDSRALVVGSIVGTIGFLVGRGRRVHRIDHWQVLVVAFVLMLPVLFFVSITQTERDLRHKMRIRHRVEHDSLTGLRNRTGLTAAMAVAPVDAVIAIDLDGFKDINDTLGHDAGDELLIALASRMAGIVGAGQRPRSHRR